MKRCPKCKQTKTLDDFPSRMHAGKMVPAAYCRLCTNAYMRERNKTAPKPNRPPGYWRWSRLEKRYGITKEQFDQMVIDQKGCCALCLQPCEQLVTDHNHETGKTRGLLCIFCNTGLGYVETGNGNWVTDAIEYLEKHKCPITVTLPNVQQ
jgi:hypothetical protein